MTAANGLAAGATHSFQILYATTGGQRSPLSPPASGKTWSGISYYGIPAEWMEEYWGYAWPLATAPLASGGPTPLQVFLTGGDPLDPSTWLRTAITRSAQGFFLDWNPQPGLTYQVQYSTNLAAWVNLGSPRFAAGNADSIYIGGNNLGYYRILCLR